MTVEDLDTGAGGMGPGENRYPEGANTEVQIAVIRQDNRVMGRLRRRKDVVLGLCCRSVGRAVGGTIGVEVNVETEYEVKKKGSGMLGVTDSICGFCDLFCLDS